MKKRIIVEIEPEIEMANFEILELDNTSVGNGIVLGIVCSKKGTLTLLCVRGSEPISFILMSKLHYQQLEASHKALWEMHIEWNLWQRLKWAFNTRTYRGYMKTLEADKSK